VKFGTAMHITPPNLTVDQKFKNPRRQMAAIFKMKNRDIAKTVWPVLTKFV